MLTFPDVSLVIVVSLFKFKIICSLLHFAVFTYCLFNYYLLNIRSFPNLYMPWNNIFTTHNQSYFYVPFSHSKM